MKHPTKTSSTKQGWESRLKLLVLVVFALSRLHIWFNRPFEFSEIIYSYMPYAHLWASGTTPYLEQWYEYPPATIPLFYIPHLVDMATRWWPVHVDYLHAYRGELLLIDTALFALIWFGLQKAYKEKAEQDSSAKKWIYNWTTNMLYYCGVTALANHFIYDSMDWVFAAALSAAAVLPILFSSPRPSASKSSQNSLSLFPQLGFIFGWISYFLATALKYINAPLGLPQLVTELPQFTQKLTPNSAFQYLKTAFKPLLLVGMSIGIGAVIVWGAPLFLYRSSIQVSILFHQLRGLQVDTPAAIIVRTINESTKSEKIIEIYKNYEVSGPLTTQTLQIVDILFPLSLLVWGLSVSWLLLKTKHQPLVRAWISLGFIFLFMLTGKVLSRPFLLWHIPIITLLPLIDLKKQLTLISLSVFMIWVSYFPVSNDAFLGLPLPIWVGWVRTTLIASLFWQWWTIKNEFITN